MLYISGDFFKGNLPKADLYSMCHVLHDWSDAECDDILKNVYDSVNPGQYYTLVIIIMAIS
jgi:hypothetical protein